MNIQNTVCLTFQLMSDRGNANPECRMYGWETVALTKKTKGGKFVQTKHSGYIRQRMIKIELPGRKKRAGLQ